MAATKFNVVLDMPLTAQQKAAINKSIQAVVRKQIADIDNKGAIVGIRRFPGGIPRDWLGIWLRRFRDLDALKRATDFARIANR